MCAKSSQIESVYWGTLFIYISFFEDFFFIWTIFKVVIEFVTILLLFYGFFWPQGIGDLSSLTRDGTCTPCIGRWRLNHWSDREVLEFYFREGNSPVSILLEVYTIFMRGINNWNPSCYFQRLSPSPSSFLKGSEPGYVLVGCRLSLAPGDLLKVSLARFEEPPDRPGGTWAQSHSPGRELMWEKAEVRDVGRKGRWVMDKN